MPHIGALVGFELLPRCCYAALSAHDARKASLFAVNALGDVQARPNVLFHMLLPDVGKVSMSYLSLFLSYRAVQSLASLDGLRFWPAFVLAPGALFRWCCSALLK